MFPLAKIFDCAMNSALLGTFCHLINEDQHGFVKGRSVATNLITYTDFIITNVEAGYQVHSVSFDLRNAFDQVNVHKLLTELVNLGLSQKTIDWFKSYLLNRKQIVKIGQTRSSAFMVTSGVGQGSHSGPALFL